MYYGAVIVIAANAGGCLTVIGDVSTLMLWVKGAVTPSSFSGAMFLPSIVAVGYSHLFDFPQVAGTDGY